MSHVDLPRLAFGPVKIGLFLFILVARGCDVGNPFLKHAMLLLQLGH